MVENTPDRWLDRESIEEFRKIWKEEFGEELPYGKAQIEAERTMKLYTLLARSLPKKEKPESKEGEVAGNVQLP